jgi:hypothetical protein
MRLIAICCLAAIPGQADSTSVDKPAYTFGTTVVNSSGFEGRVYDLKGRIKLLPDLSSSRPIGKIYTNSLNIWPQRFDEGFPGITGRFEWFAIEYTGKIWIETGGVYRFSLLADDGAKLRLDNALLINNDGIHSARAFSAAATLSRGVHSIEITYFQGPRFTVALVLAVARPGEPWRILDTDDFKPPKDPEQWTPGTIRDIKNQTSP